MQQQQQPQAPIRLLPSAHGPSSSSSSSSTAAFLPTSSAWPRVNTPTPPMTANPNNNSNNVSYSSPYNQSAYLLQLYTLDHIHNNHNRQPIQPPPPSASAAGRPRTNSGKQQQTNTNSSRIRRRRLLHRTLLTLAPPHHHRHHLLQVIHFPLLNLIVAPVINTSSNSARTPATRLLQLSSTSASLSLKDQVALAYWILKVSNNLVLLEVRDQTQVQVQQTNWSSGDSALPRPQIATATTKYRSVVEYSNG